LNWLPLTSEEQLAEIVEQSKKSDSVVALFKHSTRCSISDMAKQRLERKWDIPESQLPIYYLDLLAHRNVSNAIADIFKVKHESPQLLLVKNGKCVYNSSHNDITADSVKEFISRN
jgi:bacillithiol system protein YtxJ